MQPTADAGSLLAVLLALPGDFTEVVHCCRKVLCQGLNWISRTSVVVISQDKLDVFLAAESRQTCCVAMTVKSACHVYFYSLPSLLLGADTQLFALSAQLSAPAMMTSHRSVSDNN